MEWLNGPVETENMEVDIGYMPEMDLKSTGPSQPAILNGHDIRCVKKHAEGYWLQFLSWM